MHFRRSCAPHGPRCPDPTASAACPNLTDDNNNVSGRIGVDWKPNSAVLAYARFSRGYRGAAFNGQRTTLRRNSTSRAWNGSTPSSSASRPCFGTGGPSSIPPPSITTTATSSSSTPCPLPGGGTGFHTVNAPKSRVTGGELELRAKASKDLELRAAFAAGSRQGRLRRRGLDQEPGQLPLPRVRPCPARPRGRWPWL